MPSTVTGSPAGTGRRGRNAARAASPLDPGPWYGPYRRRMSIATVTETIAAADDLVMVDCWADWCGPCRLLSPIVDELATEVDGLTVLKVDIDAEPDFARQHDVMSVPTLLFFHHGRLVQRLVGARPKPALAVEIEALRAAVA